MISNRTHAARLFDFEITRMISAQIALHSVQLPLYYTHFEIAQIQDLVSSNFFLIDAVLSRFEIKFIHFLRGKNESFRNKSCKICHMILFVFQALKSDWLFCSQYSLLIGWEKDAI